LKKVGEGHKGGFEGVSDRERDAIQGREKTAHVTKTLFDRKGESDALGEKGGKFPRDGRQGGAGQVFRGRGTKTGKRGGGGGESSLEGPQQKKKLNPDVAGWGKGGRSATPHQRPVKKDKVLSARRDRQTVKMLTNSVRRKTGQRLAFYAPGKSQRPYSEIEKGWWVFGRRYDSPFCTRSGR